MCWTERLVVSVSAGKAIVTGDRGLGERAIGVDGVLADGRRAIGEAGHQQILAGGIHCDCRWCNVLYQRAGIEERLTPVLLLRLRPKTPMPATPAYRNVLSGVTASELIPAVANWKEDRRA